MNLLSHNRVPRTPGTQKGLNNRANSLRNEAEAKMNALKSFDEVEGKDELMGQPGSVRVSGPGPEGTGIVSSMSFDEESGVVSDFRETVSQGKQYPQTGESSYRSTVSASPLRFDSDKPSATNFDKNGNILMDYHRNVLIKSPDVGFPGSQVFNERVIGNESTLTGYFADSRGANLENQPSWKENVVGSVSN